MTANSKQIQYRQAETDYFAYPKGFAEDILTKRNQYSKLRETNLRNLLYPGALYSFPTDNKFTLSRVIPSLTRKTKLVMIDAEQRRSRKAVYALWERHFYGKLREADYE